MIVIDSSFLVALLNEDDAHHRAAVPAMERVRSGKWGPALLPEYAFLETVTVLSARVDLEFAQQEGATLLASREVELVPCSPYFAAAFEVFRTQRRTALSFADAAIVAIARHRDAERIATFDRDFRKVSTISKPRL